MTKLHLIYGTGEVLIRLNLVVLLHDRRLQYIGLQRIKNLVGAVKVDEASLVARCQNLVVAIQTNRSDGTELGLCPELARQWLD